MMPAPAYARPSVLIAEDDAVTRTLLRSLVIEMGYPVASTVDGDEAWRVFQSSPSGIVIADWLMPGVDGLELCRRVRDQVADNAFVMLVTSRDGNDDLQLALGAGVDDYITKPIAREHLRARLLIAERRLAMSKARRAAETEAARMRWLAGIGQTVLTFQHEINNPLTALYGHLETLLLAGELPGELSAEATGALGQAERIAEIVRSLAKAQQHSTVEPIIGLPMLAVPADRSSNDVTRGLRLEIGPPHLITPDASRQPEEIA
jgi:CheY-like chemotaxis protein